MPYKYTKGTCEPGYESVRGMFEQHFLDEISEFSQICVYVKGIKVIDLYGSRPKKKNTMDRQTKFRRDPLVQESLV